jgi:CHASE2 domain-containing sensor protein
MIDVDPQLFVTVAGIALVVAILVQVLKRWLTRRKEAWWYDAAVITTAFGFAFLASLAGWYTNRELIDGPVVVFLVLQAVIIGALASGGYEWVSSLWGFVGGAVEAIQTARAGDSIQVGDVEDSVVAIGRDAESEG